MCAGVFYLVPRNEMLLTKRDQMQEVIDVFHMEKKGAKIDFQEYKDLLEEIGYLVPEPEARPLHELLREPRGEGLIPVVE